MKLSSLNPVPYIVRGIKAVGSWVSSLIRHNETDILKVMAPFAQMHDQLFEIAQTAREQEQALRQQAAALYAKADVLAIKVRTTEASAQKVADLLGTAQAPVKQ